MAPDDRINGWKAISAHFGRDRTTVMRWAKDRALPVHRVPGGGNGSVFAYRHELASWTRSAMPDVDVPSDFANEPTAIVQPAELQRRSILWMSLVTGVALIATSAGGYWAGSRQSGSNAFDLSERLSVDRDTRHRFLLARDLWGRRTAEDLRQSITIYGEIIADNPNSAEAYAGLAEAWLVYREYGAVSEADAYQNARLNIERALTIDDELPSAHRASGFLAYWWSYDAERADASFRRAIQLDAHDPVTRFWYANILSDLGRHQEAEREYEIARYLLPGFRPLEVEQACALWQAGRDREAVAALEALRQRYPDDATITNCLAWAAIGRADIEAFVRYFGETARQRGDSNLLAQASVLSSAFSTDPQTAHRALVETMRQEFARGQRNTRMTPAFYASSMGDRSLLMALLEEAAHLDELWLSRNLIDRMRTRWRNDRQIIALIDAVDTRTAVK